VSRLRLAANLAGGESRQPRWSRWSAIGGIRGCGGRGNSLPRRPLFSFFNARDGQEDMSVDRYVELVRDVCRAISLPDADYVLETRTLEIEGFDVHLDHQESDPGALYLSIHFGAVTAGRSLTVFRLMLEANLLIYAQDQAQLCLDADTGGTVLLVHLPMTDDVDGAYLADLFVPYAEHGRYWQQNILDSPDDMFIGIASGEYSWLRA